MENLRREEHDTSSAITEAEGLAVRTRLHHHRLLEKVVGRGSMLHRLGLICAPSGRLE